MSKSFELLRLLKGGLRSHDIHQIIQTLLRLECGLEPGKFCIPEAVLVKLCKASGPALVKEPNLLRLEAREYVIVGDVHGQFEDLQRIFFKYGMPPRTSYIFLGDMVDRGDRSLEVMTLLLALKLEHPDHIFLLRGNHETAEVTHHFGFREECDSRSGPTTWKHFVSVFDALPLVSPLHPHHQA